MPTDSPAGMLHGLRVLDLTRVLAGPFCTMILADLGADVVKVERPDGGDDARRFGPFLPSGASAYFGGINRGKKSIALDLRNEDDWQTFLQLVERADVLVENFRPGTMESFGLAPAMLMELNPRLVYASATGFGRTGALGKRPAYDIIIQAMSGLMSITGVDPQQPVRAGTSISDLLAGLFTTIGILAALRNRYEVGRGADLDLAMLDCTVATLENAISRYDLTGQTPKPLGTRHPSIAPFQAFHAADGQFVVAAGNDALWRKLCNVIGAPELLTDPRFTTNADRVQQVELLEPELNRRFATRPVAQWLARLQEVGVPCAPIRNVADVVADPELGARGMLHRMVDTDGETFLTAGSPFRFDGAAPQLATRAPELGEHTQQVLQNWLGNNPSTSDETTGHHTTDGNS
jgi:CoA:oxalate CoA-transferase